jgi:hypothetical protein
MNHELRFDICEAWYCYAFNYHEGQASKLYSKFAQFERIGFKPAANLSYEKLTDRGKEIYDRLVCLSIYQTLPC